MTDWKPIETQPTDDLPFEIRTEDGREFVVTYRAGFLREDGSEVCSWVAEDGQSFAECWTDGVYWQSNADGVASDRPVLWRRAA